MTLRVISLGAGVQSTSMALMAAHGEIGPMPDCAIFADTGDEPAAVYEHLAWLTSGVLPFPVHIISHGALSRDALAGDNSARPPLFMTSRAGKPGMLGRQCTRNYKIRPIRRKVRDLLGAGERSYIAPGSAEAWIGISTDEIIRMKPSGVLFIDNRHPLIEHRMSRRDCLTWLETHGYPRPPKSSCWHCPYQTDEQWRDKRDRWSDDWSKAVAFDRALRTPAMVERYGVEVFVHRQRVPLDEVDLSVAEERTQPNLFLHECEGMCGV